MIVASPMRRTVVSSLIGLLLILAVPTSAPWAGASERLDKERPRVGLVLSGGGARGAAHVGVLRVLEELKVPVDVIAGTSMGSIIGGLYASGMSLDQIEEALASIDWDDALDDDPERRKLSFRRKREDDDFLVDSSPGFSDGEVKFPAGLIQGQKLSLILKELTLPVAEVYDFDHMTIPFRAVATDIVTGGMVVLGSGDLATAMRASMSVPGAFSPVEIQGRLLVDGGVSNNLPVDVARELGAEVLIVVDISTPLAGREKLGNVFGITDQLTSILTRQNTERSLDSLTDRDILIVPDLGDITTTDFDRSAEAIPKGRSAAQQLVPVLRRLSLSASEYAGYRATRRLPSTTAPVIEFVRIENRSGLGDEVLTSRIKVRLGEPLDLEALEEDISDIYGLDLFESVSYRIVEEDGRHGLVLEAVEKAWGPNYLQFGLALEGDFEGSNNFSLGVSYKRTAMNRLGGEWRSILALGEESQIFTEFYQPLDVGSRYFVNPILDLRKFNVNVFEDADRIAEYRITTYQVGLEAGRELGTWGELRAGWRWGGGEAELQVGDPALPEGSFNSGDLFLRLAWDTLDNRRFPHSGTGGGLEWLGSRESVGADEDFDQILFSWLAARTWGRHSLVLRTELNTTIDEDAPLQNFFRLGGFTQLSGLDRNELSGQHSGVASLIYFRRIGDFNLLPTYVGASLETGNTWNDRDDITQDSLITAGSLFFGVDTFVGPVYIGYGHADGGRDSVFAFLGLPY